ncbi:MAG TPA: hypothetical protein PKM72_07490 [Nitrospirales bacterium]|nr:hypothetical protein [Nitrospirales bacterium]
MARFVSVSPLAFVVGSMYEMLTTGLDPVTVILAEVRQVKAALISEVEIGGDMG